MSNDLPCDTEERPEEEIIRRFKAATPHERAAVIKQLKEEVGDMNIYMISLATDLQAIVIAPDWEEAERVMLAAFSGGIVTQMQLIGKAVEQQSKARLFCLASFEI